MSWWQNTEEEKRLFSACRDGDLVTVKLLLRHVNAEDQSYLSYRPLHHAAGCGRLNVVRYLVNEAHCDTNFIIDDGGTPLHCACRSGHLDVVRYLVNEAHCDPNVKSSNGWTPLCYACRWEHLDVVRYLVNEAHCDPNVKKNKGETPLHYGCLSGHLDVVRYLVNEAHCDPNVQNNDGWTPLHYVCTYGHLDVVRYLVNEAHCDPNVKDNDGWTPLHYACEKGHLDVIRCLVNEAHCDPNVKNNDGKTPLHYACTLGHLDVVRCVVNEAHCDPKVKDNAGEIPLHYACMGGYLDVVICLVNEAHCDPNVKNNDGKTLLHNACWSGHLDVVRYLVNEAHCDLNVKSKYGQTPLHYACKEGHLDVVRYLVNEAHCDPNDKDRAGVTLLHYACGWGYLDVVRCLVNEAHCDVKNNDGRTPLHYACREGHLDVVRYLVNEAHCDPNIKGRAGVTPLHYACEEGHLDVVRYLVNEAHCDVKNNYGRTPLHYACREGHLDVVRYLVNEAHCDPNIKDNYGQTPLHYVCKRGHSNVAECLLIESHCDPNCTLKDGSTPLAVAKDTSIIRLLLQHGAVATDLYRYREVLPASIPKQPAQSTVTVFMVGDKRAGKSTLTKALMTEKDGRISSWAAKYIKCRDVKEKTAGIECHTIHSSRIGSFTIYDLAGHREFHNSHDTVISSCISGKSPGIFLFVIDLRASLDDLKRTALYWLSFIQSQVRSEASLQVSKPYLLAVGSHVDSVKSRTDLGEKESVVQHLCKTAGNITFIDFVAVDCRYSESQSLTLLRAHLRDTHDKLQSSIPTVSFHDHCFHVYLVSECGSMPGIQLHNLMQVIESNPAISRERFLPQSLEGLHKVCKNVSERGVILYIQTQSIESSWIIIDRDMLLREVNGSVFAPENFPEYKELTRTGVVPFSKICSTFEELIKAKEIEPQLIVDFLVHMEFCREMTEEDGLKLVTETHPKYKEERHFLFPALTPPNPPPDIWQPNPQISYSEYSSCWLLECCDYQHYFTSRFREVLLLRLAFTHAFPMKPSEVDPTSLALHQHCTIWKYGIKWTTRSFVDVVVKIDDKKAVLFLFCKEGKELSLVKVRSQVIAEILSVKDEFCSKAETIEKLVPEPTYPVVTKLSIFVTDIAHVISHHEDAVHLTAHTPICISDLLFFEPYMFCNSKCLVDVQTLDNCKVTPHFIKAICRNISRLDDFCTLLDTSPHKQAVDMFEEWQSQSEGTFQCLRHQMDQYSVFSGRNVLEIASNVAQSTDSETASAVTSLPALTLEYKGNMVEVITGHMTKLTGVVSLELTYFSDTFVENDFVSERVARDVFSKTGVSGRDKASELLHNVIVNYRSTQEKQVWAEKFIAVFDAEVAYTELAAQLRRAAFTEGPLDPDVVS